MLLIFLRIPPYLQSCLFLEEFWKSIFTNVFMSTVSDGVSLLNGSRNAPLLIRLWRRARSHILPIKVNEVDKETQATFLQACFFMEWYSAATFTVFLSIPFKDTQEGALPELLMKEGGRKENCVQLEGEYFQRKW